MRFLQHIAGHAFYLPGVNNLGVVAQDDGSAIVIDTGLDRDSGRLIRKVLDAAGLRLRAIINTHHHADHIGGNDYLVRHVPDVMVFAPRIEAALIEYPILEPMALSLGTRPIAALQTKWLLAQGTRVDRLIDGDALMIGGLPLTVLPLPGHSVNQVGMAIDGVCFAADGFFGAVVLEKYGVPYAHDVAAQLASLQVLAQRDDAFFLPGHGDLVVREALPTILAANRDAIMRTLAFVQSALAEPSDLLTIARRVARALGRPVGTVPQYAIFVATIAAHLSYLELCGQAHVTLGVDGMIWHV